MSLKTKFTLLMIPLLMCSCVSRKQLTYFHPITAESAEAINQHNMAQPEPTVKVNDALIITVTALDPEAAIPYNLASAPYVSPNSDYVPTASTYQFYTVDTEGNISFPVLGKLHVAGKTLAEVINMIQDKLKEQIVNPLVTIRFLNANVTVLGEVKVPGSYPLNNGRMTLLEALGAAGDLTQYGRRDNILITRENNGKLEFELIFEENRNLVSNGEKAGKTGKLRVPAYFYISDMKVPIKNGSWRENAVRYAESIGAEYKLTDKGHLMYTRIPEQMADDFNKFLSTVL